MGFDINEMPASVAATPSLLVQRDSNGVAFGVNHASTGSAGSAGASVVLDSGGHVPLLAIPGGAGPVTGSPTETYEAQQGRWTGSTSSDGTTTSTMGSFGQFATVANGATTITINRDACGNLTSIAEA